MAFRSAANFSLCTSPWLKFRSVPPTCAFILSLILERGTSGLERAKNIFLFPTRERNWAVMEEASGQHFAHYSDYEEAEEFALELARSRRVRDGDVDHAGGSRRGCTGLGELR